MVPCGAFEYPAGVIDFAQDEALGQPKALVWGVRRAVLRLTQQDIAAFLAYSACEEPASRCEKGQVDAAFDAGAHERRGSAGVGKGENALKRVQRETRDLLALAADDHVFAIKAEVAVLGEDKERVQQLSHMPPPIASSMCSRTYLPLSPRLYRDGRQSSFKEQALQCLPGFTLGV